MNNPVDLAPKAITIYDSDKTYKGYTLFCPMCHTPNVASGELAHMYLIDMNGMVVHKWSSKTSVQLLELMANGNLYCMTRDSDYPLPVDLPTSGIREIDPQSNVVWYFHCRSDHDFQVMDNGNLMILCFIDKMAPGIGPELKRSPYIIEITKEKELVWEWFGENHTRELENLCSIGFPLRMDRRYGEQQAGWVRNPWDWAHNNTLEVLPETALGRKDSRFRGGNILFSYRNQNTVGIIDRKTGEIVWAWGRGQLDSQHQPTMLPNGNILIFDNGTKRGWSRVIEVNPLEEEIIWEYHGTPQKSFYSPFISGAQLLPNGNIFICEGGPLKPRSPRLFEITREGEIVWEYLSPFTPPVVYRATRYAEQHVQSLLSNANRQIY